jgi:sugar porter (SP) family MFS transporter
MLYSNSVISLPSPAGVLNNSRDIIIEYFEQKGQAYSLVHWGVTVSCYGVGGLLGSLVGPRVLGLFMGRKTTLLVNNLFLMIACACIAWAPVWWVQAIGRIFQGMVAGIATAVVPTYLSEISPIAIRGGVGTMHQLAITMGILISQYLSTPSLLMFGSIDKWKLLFLVPALCGVFQLIFLPWLPESPSYLYAHIGREAARDAIVRLQSEDVADEYLGYIEQELYRQNNNANDNKKGASIEERLQQPPEEDSMTMMELLCDRTLRKQLIVGTVVQLMMQFSGIDAVFYYSTSVFQQASVVDPELATTGLGIINVLVTIVAVRYMDTAGRQILLKWSWMGMCTSYVILTASFVLQPYLPGMGRLSVISMTGVIIFFAFGPGCIAWFIIAEIFPLYARDSAQAFGIFINWIANWLVAFSFPILLVYTQPFTFLIFVASTSYFLYFTLHFVPETKGKTVKEVTDMFREIPIELC